MPPKANPSKLNPLQLRTLTLLQAIARIPDAAAQTPDGDTAITQVPPTPMAIISIWAMLRCAAATPPGWRTRKCGTPWPARA